MSASSAARQWFLTRSERACRAGLEELFAAVGDHLAIAAAAAVSIRLLSSDGAELLPVSAHHPDPHREAAMFKVMADTTQPAGTGLWAVALAKGGPVRWHLENSRPPTEASARQASFISEQAITAVIGLPLSNDAGRVLGGVALVRYGAERPFSDDDEALLVAAGHRLAPLLQLLRALDRDED